tara:strand:- start:174 stop:749 length:576 start_codon:yes stop_codon:yes gene_type:complete
MAYFLGRDVSVTIASGSDVGVASGALVFDGSGTDFSSNAEAGLAVSDLTGVDLGIGVTDEDITYMGSRTVLKAEIKKETTVTLTRKKSDNVWDVVFNGDGTPDTGARWGADTSGGAIANLAGEPSISGNAPTGSDTDYFGYQLKITLKSGTEVFTVPYCQITAHTVTLNADGTTEETLEFVSQETPSIGTT